MIFIPLIIAIALALAAIWWDCVCERAEKDRAYMAEFRRLHGVDCFQLEYQSKT